MKKNNKKGFTLVELVIVVAVMAILVAVAIPTVSSITTTARNATNDSNARTIESMIKLEAAEKENAQGTSVSIDATLITSALTDAKLGIKSTTFYYNSTTGDVTTAQATGFKIVFDGAGAFTVTSQS